MKNTLLASSLLLLAACSNQPVTTPAAVGPEAKAQAEQHFKQARLHSAQNQRELALQELDKAIALDGTNADYYARRGHVKREQNKREDAAAAAGMDDINRALQLNPDHGYANFDRAIARYVQGDLKGALGDAGKAVQADPASPRFLGTRCIIGAAAGEGAASLDYCQRALALEKGKETAYAALGQAYLELNRNQEALTAFEDSLKHAPNLMRALYGRGLARQKLGDATGAADLRTAVERLPGAGREYREARAN